MTASRALCCLTQTPYGICARRTSARTPKNRTRTPRTVGGCPLWHRSGPVCSWMPRPAISSSARSPSSTPLLPPRSSSSRPAETCQRPAYRPSYAKGVQSEVSGRPFPPLSNVPAAPSSCAAPTQALIPCPHPHGLRRTGNRCPFVKSHPIL